MEGDDELLADMEVKAPPKRDEWMTTLPPERKVRAFSLSSASQLLFLKVQCPVPLLTVTVSSLQPGGGVPMHSTKTFSRTSKEGRGDTSVWTDTPSDRAQKAKMK